MSMPSLTLDCIDRVAETAVRTGAPVVLFGAPGVGKTAALQEWTARAGRGCVLLNATSVLAFDLIGMPVASKGVSVFTTPTWLAEIVHTGKSEGLLVLDELGTASPEVVPAFAQLLGERRCGPHHLPRGWAVIGTSNRPGDRALSRPLPAHLVNRVACWTVQPSAEAWCAWARRQPLGALPPELVAYVGSPDFEPWLDEMNPRGVNEPWTSFRSLTLGVGDLLAMAEVTTGERKVLFGPEAMSTLSARVPLELASAFLDFAVFGQQVPAWKDIVEAPDLAVVPETPKAGMIAAEMVYARAMAATREECDHAVANLARWLRRCPGAITAQVAGRLYHEATLRTVRAALDTRFGTEQRPFFRHTQFARLYPALVSETAPLGGTVLAQGGHA